MKTEMLTPTITRIIEKQVLNSSKCEKESDKIFNALHILLNGEYEKYNFNTNIINESLFGGYYSDDIQSLLSKINEKQTKQKENGRFYTPKDVTEYIVANTFVNILDNTTPIFILSLIVLRNY